MSRFPSLVIVVAGLFGSGCAVASNRSYTVERDGLTPDGETRFCFRVQNAGPVNALCREPLFIPLVVYAEYQGPPFTVTLEVSDDEHRLEKIRITRVTLIREDGHPEEVPIPQPFCTFRDESGVRKALFPVVEDLARHEPLELRVEAVVRQLDGTEVEIEMSGRLVPEKRQGITDAVTFTAYGVT